MRRPLIFHSDEPTSGLDSQTAWSTCKLLQKLAHSGQAILCTIHQPSALLFQTFDQLLVLGSNGKPLYFGEIGPGAATMTEYFESQGARKCQKQENPAEWLLDVTGAAVGSNSDIDWSQIWRNSSQKKQVKSHLSDIKRELPALQTRPNKVASEEYAVPFFTQLWTVTVRNFQQDWRVPSYLYSKFLLSTGTVSPFYTSKALNWVLIPY